MSFNAYMAEESSRSLERVQQSVVELLATHCGISAQEADRCISDRSEAETIVRARMGASAKKESSP